MPVTTPMRRVTLAYAKRNLAKLVADVRLGEPVFIKHRGGGRAYGAVLSRYDQMDNCSVALDSASGAQMPGSCETVTLDELRNWFAVSARPPVSQQPKEEI